MFEIWRLKKKVKELRASGKEVPAYVRSMLRTLNRDLCRMRSVAVMYKEYSSIWNMQVLGEKWVNEMKRDLPPLTFQTSILCKRIGIAKDGFYSSMTPRHKYQASNFDYLNSLEYKFDKPKQPTCLADSDIDPLMPICIAFDFNNNINWLIAGQPQGSKLRVIKSFFVKYERKLPELIADFCSIIVITRPRRWCSTTTLQHWVPTMQSMIRTSNG